MQTNLNVGYNPSEIKDFYLKGCQLRLSSNLFVNLM